MSKAHTPKTEWPDALQPPQPEQIQHLLDSFWVELAHLADLLPRDQVLLAAEQLHTLRAIVLQMMLALNGIQRPQTRNLNIYLSANQRAALEKTLLLSNLDPGSNAHTGEVATDSAKAWADAWLGQAVSLVVIYRWYAPQLVAKYALRYPHTEEQAAWTLLTSALPTWPQEITTE